MAYEGLMEFVHHLQSVPQSARHLQHVYFVNIDKEMTDAMGNVMKALFEKKYMFLSQPAEKPEEKSQTELFVASSMPGGRVRTGILRGNQPPGSFTSRHLPQLDLSGYEQHGAIEITYQIPDGIQTVSDVL